MRKDKKDKKDKARLASLSRPATVRGRKDKVKVKEKQRSNDLLRGVSNGQLRRNI